jgi:hypothetical protein
MKTRAMSKAIQCKTQQKSQQHLQTAVEFKRHPQNEKEINIGCYHLVQVYFVQYIKLHQDQ